MKGDKGTVCVTGGTGFIASWLIMRLLEHGYIVRTTVRPDPEKRRDLSFLTGLTGATEKLQIFNADLNEPDSFNPAIEGCTGVLHLATPMDFEGKEPDDVVTQRTINGTLGILKACLTSKTVKRVIYTSSASAILVGEDSHVDVMDESFWSDVYFIRKTIPYGTYLIAKTAAEKAAIQFANENGLDLVSVVPSAVLGPFICPHIPISVQSGLALVLGNEDMYAKILKTSVVHVDDLVRAYMFLLEYPEAKGMYICSSHTITIQEMSRLLSTKYPEYSIPTEEYLAEIRSFKAPSLSSKKLLDTGFKYLHGVEDMFDGAIQCSKKRGYL